MVKQMYFIKSATQKKDQKGKTDLVKNGNS